MTPGLSGRNRRRIHTVRLLEKALLLAFVVGALSVGNPVGALLGMLCVLALLFVLVSLIRTVHPWRTT